jgi:hypothetical protein
MKFYFKFVCILHNWSTKQMTYSYKKMYPKYPITFKGQSDE